MMGTSLLSMPWALEQAGLLMGLACMAVIAGLCLYTAYRIIQVYDIHSESIIISPSLLYRPSTVQLLSFCNF